MSTQDILGLREQILANARFLIRVSGPSGTVESSSTLFNSTEEFHVVISGEGTRMRGVLMLGLKPAIEGGEATSPESALRKLLLAVTETMSLYTPKIGDHMRNIHGGGIFDEDLIIPELKDGQRRSSGPN